MPAPPETLTQATVFYVNGQLEAAERHCRMALAAQPRLPAALRLLAAIRRGQGNLDDAAFLLSVALSQVPDDADAINDLACIRLDQGQAQEAVTLFDRALAHAPYHADSHVNILGNRANALMVLQRLEEAAADYHAAIALRPGDKGLRLSLARLLLQQGKPLEAATVYRNAIAADPKDTTLYALLGALLLDGKRYEESRAVFGAAVMIDPKNADAWNNFAASLVEAGGIKAGLYCLQQAIALQPDNPTLKYNMGNALVVADRHEEALPFFHQALALRPDYHDCWFNLGGALIMLARPEAAIDAFHKARRTPDDPRARFSEALAQLSAGRLKQGFALYEARLALPDITPPDARYDAIPRCRDEGSLKGLKLLVHGEQGLGDTVQFARYVPWLAARGARVTLEAPLPLMPLLETLKGVEALLPAGTQLDTFDARIPLMSLPMLFGTDLHNVPGITPYLQPLRYRVDRWRGVTGWQHRKRIGIAWSGNPAFGNDRQRSMPLSLLAPLRDCGYTVHAIQRGMNDADREVLQGWPDVINMGDESVDLADAAAIISIMDLIITVDTSLAHVAGAINKPAWLMLPYACDWRWMLAREDSPWYPSLRLFRQTAPGDWQGVITRVQAALRKI